MIEVIVLQHTAIEGPGRLGDALVEAGLTLRIVRAGEGEPIPRALDGASGLVLLGGPMGVHDVDRYPFLRDELALLERTLAAEVPILGVCLGSELLAAALGARVLATGRLELGWSPVTLSDDARVDPVFAALPPVFDALHWHGDAFELPIGARALASSALTELQAFSFGERAWGTLFHLEAPLAQVRAMAREFEDDLRAAGIAASELLAASEAHDERARSLAASLYGAWASRCAKLA